MATGSSVKKAQTANGAKELPKKKFNNDLFLGGIEGILRAENHMGEEEKRDDSPAFWDALGVWSGMLSAPYEEEFDNAVDAINAFEQWLSESDWSYVAPVHFTTTGFTITLTMPAASGEISVAMNCITSDGTDLSTAISSAKKALQSAVIAAFPRSAERNSKPAKQTGNNQSSNDKGSVEEVDIDCLRIVEFNGKLVARLIPTEGKWTQFGLPLYDDVAKELGIKLPKKPGDYDCSGLATYETKPDGKPKRVIGLESAPEDDE